MRALIPMLMLVTACGGGVSTDAARLALSGATQALKVTDEAFQPIYDAARDSARETSDTWPERDRKTAPYDRVEKALDAAHGALLLAEAALDLGEADSIGERAACAADALSELRAALKAADIDRPPGLSKADAALRALGSACRGRE